jgi:uncharacterized membrane protein (DUF2068 family)
LAFAVLNKLIQRSVKAIAVFEGGKGLLVLLGTTLFVFVYDADAHRLAMMLIHDLHYDPDAYYPHMLLMIADTFTGMRLTLLIWCGYLYSAIKLSESYGLWRERQWGRTLGILSIGVLIPFEVYETIQHFSFGKLTILALNILVVALLFLGMKRGKAHRAR